LLTAALCPFLSATLAERKKRLAVCVPVVACSLRATKATGTLGLSARLKFSHGPSPSMSAARISAELNPPSHLAVKSGLAISSADVDCGCSAFQRMAAVMRVRPLG